MFNPETLTTLLVVNQTRALVAKCRRPSAGHPLHQHPRLQLFGPIPFASKSHFPKSSKANALSLTTLNSVAVMLQLTTVGCSGFLDFSLHELPPVECPTFQTEALGSIWRENRVTPLHAGGPPFQTEAFALLPPTLA